MAKISLVTPALTLVHPCATLAPDTSRMFHQHRHHHQEWSEKGAPYDATERGGYCGYT